MTSHRPARASVEIVSLATQDERERLAMVIMQLEMSLVMAKQRELFAVECHLKAAISRIKSADRSLLH